jgi:hypothetical protein
VSLRKIPSLRPLSSCGFPSGSRRDTQNGPKELRWLRFAPTRAAPDREGKKVQRLIERSLESVPNKIVVQPKTKI